VALFGDRLADLTHRRADFVTLYFSCIFGLNPRGRDLVVQSAHDVITYLQQLFLAAQNAGLVRDDCSADMMASFIFMNRLAYSRMLDVVDVGNHSHAQRLAFLFDMHWRAIAMKTQPEL
jgi:hypothetical protein